MKKPLILPLINDNHRQALGRDRGMCVLTCEPRPEVAHIIPYSFGRHADPLNHTMPNVMAFLEVFAGRDVVNNINNYLMRPSAHGRGSQNNRVENLLSLAPIMHHGFGSGILCWSLWGTRLKGEGQLASLLLQTQSCTKIGDVGLPRAAGRSGPCCRRAQTGERREVSCFSGQRGHTC